MEPDRALKVFGIEPGSKQTRSSILKRYRRLSFEHHPDYGGDAEKFKELTDAYQILAKIFKNVVDLGDEKTGELTTIGGQKLSDLGKGYPITESAKTCDGCDGKGYRKYSGTRQGTGHYGKCAACDGTGLVFYPCRKCGGTGRFIHPKSKKDIGECFGCKGTGRFYPFMKKRLSRFTEWYDFGLHPRYPKYIPGTQQRGQACKECYGSGEREIATDGQPYYQVCDKCGGIGEEKMWNPVIPRGYLTGQG